ncbi:hypothetical protein OG780_34405 [Streptomyces sp. NBC_00386]|uniref:hypothetical protein n=1 Tax=Streptomyces sp. NBC_00386 TaxID=2975734 RepID=UPI002E20A511
MPTPCADFHDSVDIDGDRRPRFVTGLDVRRQCCSDRLEPGREGQGAPASLTLRRTPVARPRA